VAPRVGVLLGGGRLKFWPRAGITFVHASSDRSDLLAPSRYHVGADLELFLAASPVRGVTLVMGPSLGVPLAGRSFVIEPASRFTRPVPNASPRDSTLLTVALTAGLVVGFR
jgi:hypothetical protein